MKNSLIKKIYTLTIFSLTLAISSMSYGQINYTQDFNGCNTTANPSNCNGWRVSGGFARGISPTRNCSNSAAFANVYTANPTAELFTTASLGISTGLPATFSFNSKCIDYTGGAATAANSCTYTLYWGTAVGGPWNLVSTYNNVQDLACNSHTFPSFTPTAGQNVFIRVLITFNAGDFWAVIDDISLTQPDLPTATLLNMSAEPTLSTSFAHRRGASIRPKFTISGAAAFDAVQIEMNQLSDFSGAALVSTLDDGTNYNASTPYDFWTTEDLTGDRTYFVRVRLSDNGGSTWGPWSTQFWPYSYYPATTYPEEGWYFTTREQFLLGTVDESTYNFVSVLDNSTPYPDDDYFQVNQGSFNVNAGTNDGVYENGTWYPTVNYMTMGWQNNCNGNAAIYNGFPFTLNIPQGANILSSGLSAVASDACFCETQNVALRLIFDAHDVDNGAAYTAANVTSLVTPARTTAKEYLHLTDAWTNNTRYTLTNNTSILQEVIDRAGWGAGNRFNYMMYWDNGYAPGANNNRCIRQADNGAASAPNLTGTFTNFYNTVRFPSVNRAIYGPDATSWDELRVTDNTVGCGTCYVEYRIHDAGTNAVLAGPFLRPEGMSTSQYFDISGVAAANIYVSTRVYRNNTPLVHDIWLTATEISPLPVEWKKVEGHCLPDGNEIRWETASEQDNDYFTVERSSDGTTWDFICQIDGAGNSNHTNAYSCFDPSIREAIYYYRVRQTDYDGETKVSDIISVNCDEKSDLKIYPNPTQGRFTLDGGKLGMEVVLYDPTGRIILEKEINSHSTEFDISNYNKGLYLLEVKEHNSVQNFKIVVN